jgi:hypothetical protein
MSRRRTADRVLGLAAWLIMAVGLCIDLALGGASRDPNRHVLLATLAGFLLTILARAARAVDVPGFAARFVQRLQTRQGSE